MSLFTRFKGVVSGVKDLVSSESDVDVPAMEDIYPSLAPVFRIRFIV